MQRRTGQALLQCGHLRAELIRRLVVLVPPVLVLVVTVVHHYAVLLLLLVLLVVVLLLLLLARVLWLRLSVAGAVLLLNPARPRCQPAGLQ